MARKPPEPTRTRRLAAARQREAAKAPPECGACRGVECRTGRVPVCCPDCTHGK
jgi:hypothetical protein